MRNKFVAVFVVSLITAGAAATYVAPSKDGVGIYPNEIRTLSERPLCTVGTGVRLTVVGDGRDCYKVTTGEGCEGWVEKRLVGTFKTSKVIQYDETRVDGSLDKPGFVWISGNPDSSPDEDIVLKRSFLHALRDHTDRETVERQIP